MWLWVQSEFHHSLKLSNCGTARSVFWSLISPLNQPLNVQKESAWIKKSLTLTWHLYDFQHRQTEYCLPSHWAPCWPGRLRSWNEYSALLWALIKGRLSWRAWPTITQAEVSQVTGSPSAGHCCHITCRSPTVWLRGDQERTTNVSLRLKNKAWKEQM